MQGTIAFGTVTFDVSFFNVRKPVLMEVLTSDLVEGLVSWGLYVPFDYKDGLIMFKSSYEEAEV